MSLVGNKHRKQYITAETVTAGGALRFPYISGPVPVKSKTAVPVEYSYESSHNKLMVTRIRLIN